MASDPINPAHYKAGSPLEVINIIEAYGLTYCEGNAVKYILRARRKENQLQDLKKAEWYVQREIRRLENGVNEEGVTRATPEKEKTEND